MNECKPQDRKDVAPSLAFVLVTKFLFCLHCEGIDMSFG